MSAKWTLVTGANGFLGARLVRQLVERGEHVKAFVRPGANLDQLRDLPRERVRIAVGDVRIEDRVYAAMRSCDRCYHVAGRYSFDERERRSIMEDTFDGTGVVLEAARRADLARIVVTSTILTLGPSKEKEPLDETTGLNLSDPVTYTEAKYSAENLALERADAGLPVVVVNPGLIVGAGDWKPTPIGAQIVRYLGLSPSFRVPIVPTGFSYVDVDDVARGHILAMDRGQVGQRYVLGGENLTLREFYTLLSDITGLAEPGADLSREKAEMAATYERVKAWWSGQRPLLSKKFIQNYHGKYVFVSSEKAQRDLGYEYRPVREALSRACRWYLERDYLPAHSAKRARLELLPA